MTDPIFFRVLSATLLFLGLGSFVLAFLPNVKVSWKNSNDVLGAVSHIGFGIIMTTGSLFSLLGVNTHQNPLRILPFWIGGILLIIGRSIDNQPRVPQNPYVVENPGFVDEWSDS